MKRHYHCNTKPFKTRGPVNKGSYVCLENQVIGSVGKSLEKLVQEAFEKALKEAFEELQNSSDTRRKGRD